VEIFTTRGLSGEGKGQMICIEKETGWAWIWSGIV